MLSAFSIMMKAAFAPVWLLWRLYLVMWWAFDNRSGPIAPAMSMPAQPPIPNANLNTGTAPAGQDSAFQVSSSTHRSTPSRSELPAPIGTLKGGFAGALVASAASGFLAGGLAAEHQIHGEAAFVLWGWLTAVAMVGSLFAVRRIVARRESKREARRQVFVNAAKVMGGAVGGAFGVVGRATGAAAANVASAFSAAKVQQAAEPGADATGATAPARGFARNAACVAGRGACRAWSFARDRAPIVGSKLVATLKRMGDPVKAASPQTSA